jgi:hypothetical protein
MYRSPVTLRRLEIFALPPKNSSVAPLHRYHHHDLLEWIVDNEVSFLFRLLTHWEIPTQDMTVEESVKTVALLLYNRVVEDTSSMGLRSIKIEPDMRTVSWINSLTWRYDCMRMERQRFRPRYNLSVVPDYRTSIDKLGAKLNLKFVHPCRYMNWIQYEQENDKKKMWRFARSRGMCRSNYYDISRNEMTEIGLNGNFTPLLSYGDTEKWITYSCEELEESVRRGTLPLSLPLSDCEEGFYEPGVEVLQSLHTFLRDLQGSIYTPFFKELYEILHESFVLTKDLHPASRTDIIALNNLAYRLRPGEDVDIEIMNCFSNELFGELHAFTRTPSFRSLNIPLVRVYEKTFTGNMCCADFAEIVLTTTQVYAGKFCIEIEHTEHTSKEISRKAHIDYFARLQLNPSYEL